MVPVRSQPTLPTHLIVLILSLLLLLVRQNDKNATEDVDKIEEQIDGVPDEIPIPVALLLDDELRVVENESTEHEQSTVQMQLEHRGGPVSRNKNLF